MKRWLSVVAVAVASVAMSAVAVDAVAKRLGGGGNLGVQRQALPKQPATPQPPANQAAPSTTPPPAAAPAGAAAAPAAAAPAAAAPAAGATVAGKPATAAAQAPAAGAAAAKPGMSRWLGPIAGIAAGLGLAALLSHLGLSETFASLLLLVLLAVGAVLIVRWLLRRGSAPAQRPAYAGAGAAGSAPLGRDARSEPQAPVERRSHAAPPADSRIEPTFSSPPAATGATPQGFDAVAFLQHARANFNRLQSAWDKGDLAAIGDFVTPAMYAQIERDVKTRQGHRPTEVLRLEGEVVEVKTEPDAHWVGVRFTGLVREDGAEVATPFDEVWNLTKPVDGSSGWVLAGIEQH